MSGICERYLRLLPLVCAYSADILNAIITPLISESPKEERFALISQIRWVIVIIVPSDLLHSARLGFAFGREPVEWPFLPLWTDGGETEKRPQAHHLSQKNLRRIAEVAFERGH